MEPLTLAETKAHLRVDESYTEDDAYITALIMVARDYTEGFQGRTLAQRTLQLTLDHFPHEPSRVSNGLLFYRNYSPIKLPSTPVSSVLSVTYTLSDGIVKTLPSTEYIVKEDGAIVPAFERYWPIDVLVPADAVKITYEAGYTPDRVPPATKQGMLLLIGNWYENREPVVLGRTVEKIPFTVECLLWMDRTW